ncbi:Hypothetical protein FKW44_004402 [Caligus rogercresseyi]|uniref:Uncharacterized protein n=1 Tax=Caligus rogercresseyi TaxID=217165 RepID=A0A7T8HM30_CALRO|nr:Hypothetical protein FKW44_004402 [Caligus rogercresseyi]
MASKALFSKCEWCDVPILHRGDLEAHQGNCPKRVTLGEVETKGASMDGPLRRLLLESSKDCLGCQRHADLLREPM